MVRLEPQDGDAERRRVADRKQDGAAVLVRRRRSRLESGGRVVVLDFERELVLLDEVECAVPRRACCGDVATLQRCTLEVADAGCPLRASTRCQLERGRSEGGRRRRDGPWTRRRRSSASQSRAGAAPRVASRVQGIAGAGRGSRGLPPRSWGGRGVGDEEEEEEGEGEPRWWRGGGSQPSSRVPVDEEEGRGRTPGRCRRRRGASCPW